MRRDRDCQRVLGRRARYVFAQQVEARDAASLVTTLTAQLIEATKQAGRRFDEGTSREILPVEGFGAERQPKMADSRADSSREA